MTAGRIVVGFLAVIAGLVGTQVLRRRRHHLTRGVTRTGCDLEWNLSDDLTQAVANALPHESGAFNIPARNSPP